MASNLPTGEFRGGNLGAWDSETKYQPEKTLDFGQNRWTSPKDFTFAMTLDGEDPGPATRSEEATRTCFPDEMILVPKK
jgi:hypothetical protein